MEKHCSESSSVGSFACNTKCMEGSAPSSFSSPQQQQQQQQEEEEGEAVKEVSKKLKQDTQQAEQELLPLPAPASDADGNQTLLHAPPATETISGMEEEEEDNAYPSAAELVAKARAPVKREFLQKASLRILPYSSTEIVKKENVPAGETGAGAKISVDKKSKRQVKKERTQARKSAENVCAAVAKTGDVNACPFGAKCRFNHDLDSFLAQKPPDLPGACPFLVAAGKGCPYGLACRFAGTHVGVDGLGSVEFANESSQLCEYNFLSKDFQRKLWKRLVSFSKADAELQKLGIKNIMKGKEPPKSGETGDIKPTQVESASNLEDTSAILRMDVDGRDGNHLNVDDSETIMNASIEQEFSNKEIIVPLREDALLDEECSVQENGIVSGEKHDEEKLLGSSNMVPEDMSVIDVHKKKEASLTGDFMECKLTKREKKIIDFRGKLYLAPLTTVGNLPFRRVCKRLGAEITCGEMAMCTNLLQGQASEWALLRRHADEDLFGVQICGSYPDTMARTAELIEKECQVSFVDINVGCPIDIVVNKGAGSCLLTRPARLEQIIRAISATLTSPLTFKVRTGYFEGRNCIHSLIADIHKSGATAISVHGRTRQQRYSKLADWDYIYQCASIASNDLQVIGNGDIFAYTDWNEHMSSSNLSTCMIARGALIKPWIFTEIKEQRHWDITASERLDILKDYVRFGIEHWGSDSKGVETTRHFLLELLSYMHRYIPVGLLEVVPQRLNWRPPNYFGRTELETLMASDSAADWVRISEMLLGPAPANFVFTPRHKSNAYDKVENG